MPSAAQRPGSASGRTSWGGLGLEPGRFVKSGRLRAPWLPWQPPCVRPEQRTYLSLSGRMTENVSEFACAYHCLPLSVARQHEYVCKPLAGVPPTGRTPSDAACWRCGQVAECQPGAKMAMKLNETRKTQPANPGLLVLPRNAPAVGSGIASLPRRVAVRAAL